MHFSPHFPALPKVGMRIFKTLGAVLLVCVAYELLGGRNPCFACIDHNCYRIGGPQLLSEHPKSSLKQRQFIGLIH